MADEPQNVKPQGDDQKPQYPSRPPFPAPQDKLQEEENKKGISTSFSLPISPSLKDKEEKTSPASSSVTPPTSVPTPTPVSTPNPAPPVMPAPVPTKSSPTVDANKTESPTKKPEDNKPIEFSTPLPRKMPEPSAMKPAPSHVRPLQNVVEQPKPKTPSPPAAAEDKTVEYKTKIRTMEDDIKELKTGRKPSGITIDKTFTKKLQEKDKPADHTPPNNKPHIPASVLPEKSSMFHDRQTKELGEVEKSKTLAAPSIRSFRITDLPEGKGEEKPKKEEEKPKKEIKGTPLEVPREAHGPFSFDNIQKPLIFIALPILTLVIAAVAYMFFGQAGDDSSIGSPTPVETSTESPSPVRNLSTMFGVTSELVILNTDYSKTAKGFRDLIKQISVQQGQFTKLAVTGSTEDVTELGLFDLLDIFSITYPADILSNLGEEKAVLLYGHGESFDVQGVRISVDQLQQRLVFVLEATDPNKISTIIKDWEITMVDAFSELFAVDPEKASSAEFLVNVYEGSLIKYKNFPYADTTIDHVIVSASNGKTYLVFGSSRNAVFKTIQKLR